MEQAKESNMTRQTTMKNITEGVAGLNRLAAKLGDRAPEKNDQGFSNQIFLGERFVYKCHKTSGQVPTAKQKKEALVLRHLAQCLDSSMRPLVPELIHEEQVSEEYHVVVQQRLTGCPPERLDQTLAESLGRFLSVLHTIPQDHWMDEFEGEEHRQTFRSYLFDKPLRFAEKLNRSESVDTSDRELIRQAVAAITFAAQGLSDSVPLVLNHKDLFERNLLQHRGRLTGIIDWDAAQTAPREWEFAILRQRIPQFWDAAHRCYGTPIDPLIMDCCALAQSLRFWKSFPHHADFANVQRCHIRDILRTFDKF